MDEHELLNGSTNPHLFIFPTCNGISIREVFLSEKLLCKHVHNCCCNPTLAKCGGQAQHLEKVMIWSPSRLPNVQSLTARLKTYALWCSWCHWKGLEAYM